MFFTPDSIRFDWEPKLQHLFTFSFGRVDIHTALCQKIIKPVNNLFPSLTGGGAAPTTTEGIIMKDSEKGMKRNFVLYKM